jgi:hypothetical protein
MTAVINGTTYVLITRTIIGNELAKRYREWVKDWSIIIQSITPAPTESLCKGGVVIMSFLIPSTRLQFALSNEP